MTAPTIYRSDDASAPVLSGTVGSLIALLDAVLVNGYGAKPAAGWTKPHSGTNLAAYRMASGGTSRQMYLRVDDTNAQYGLVRGYDNMTAISIGTEDFPTVAQVAAGLVMPKSNAASAASRPWVALATNKCFYFWSQCSTTTIGTSDANEHQVFFGEYPTYLSGFTYNCALIASSSTNLNIGVSLGTLPHPDGATALPGHYLCRSHLNVSGSAQFAKAVSQFSRMSTGSPNVIGLGGDLSTPDPVTGKVYGSRVRVLSPSWALLGHLPGFWASHADAAMGSVFDTINGAGALSGKTLMCMNVGSSGASGGNSNTYGRGLFDTTNFD